MTSTLRLAAKMDITVKLLHPALQDQITSLIKIGGDSSSKEEHKKSKDKGDKEHKKDKGKKEKKEQKEDKKDRAKAEGVEEKDKVKKEKSEKEKDRKDKQSEASKSHKKAFFFGLKSIMTKTMTQFDTCCLHSVNRYLFLRCHYLPPPVKVGSRWFLHCIRHFMYYVTQSLTLT